MDLCVIKKLPWEQYKKLIWINKSVQVSVVQPRGSSDPDPPRVFLNWEVRPKLQRRLNFIL